MFPGPRMTTTAPAVRVYSYLLCDWKLTHVDEIWSSEITYVPRRRAFIYLTAVVDYYSRYILSWRLSKTLDAPFCLEVLDEVLSKARPEIFSTDQGSQSPSREYTNRLKEGWLGVSRDVRGVRWTTCSCSPCGGSLNTNISSVISVNE